MKALFEKVLLEDVVTTSVEEEEECLDPNPQAFE